MNAPNPVDDATPGGLAALASHVANEAGLMVKARLGDRHTIDTKSSHLDLVTEVDRASEKLIVSRLLDARPDDGIVGEEGSTVTGSSGVNWLVDPIDGTTSFVYGLPGFSISIAARIDDETVAAVVRAPVIGSEYRAVLGAGTTHDGRPVRVGDPATLATALVATGFAPHDDRRRRQGQQLAQIIARIRDIRRMGSAALDLAAVAASQVDAYYELGLCEWDWAAGALLVTEAGGRIMIERDPESERAFVAASGPRIADELFALLHQVGANEF